MRRLAIVLTGLLLSAAAGAAGAAGAQRDLARMQGTWALESVESEGRLLPAGAARRELVIDGETWRSVGDDAGAGVLQLDASRRPKHLDMTRTLEDGSAGRSAPCLYRLEGDRLLICRQPVGPGPYRRPQRFTAEGGSGTMIFTWRRLR